MIARHDRDALGRTQGLQPFARELHLAVEGEIHQVASDHQMVDAGRKFFPARWWYSAMPGMTIFIVALAFSVLGDALRDRKGGASRAAA